MKKLVIVAIACMLMISAFASDTLSEGHTQTYRIGGEDYEVTVIAISDSAQATIRVNGETLSGLRAGDTFTLSTGEGLTLSAVNAASAQASFGFSNAVTHISERDMTPVCRDVPEQRKQRCQDDYKTLRMNNGYPPDPSSEGIATTTPRIFTTNKEYEVQVKDTTYTHTELWVNGEVFAIAPYEIRQLADGARIQLLAQDFEKKYAYIQIFRAPLQVTSHDRGFPYSMMQNNKFIASVIVGDNAPSTDVIAATDIMSSVQKKIPNTRTGLSKLASEVTFIGNMLSIGTPCDNPITEEVTGISDCTFGLLPGQGYIGFYNHNNAQQVIVSGYSPEEVRIAARALTNWKHQPGNAFIVEGTLGHPSVRPISLKQARAQSPTQPPLEEGTGLTPPSFPGDEHHIALYKGWNLVSLPGRLVEFRPNTCEKKPVAFTYLPDEQRSVSLKDAQNILGENLRSHLAEHAFWIYSFTECEQPVVLEEYAPTIQLTKTWNMIPNIDTPCSEEDYWWNVHDQEWTQQEPDHALARVVKIQEGCTA